MEPKVALFLGDCLEVMKQIPDGSVDMVLCDLPYGTTACKWDTVIPFQPLWAEYERVTKENAAIVLFGSEPFTSTLVMSNIKNFKYEWVWKKNRFSNFLLAKQMPGKVHENICVFYRASPVYNPQPRELSLDTKKRSNRNWSKEKYDRSDSGQYVAINITDQKGKTSGVPTSVLDFKLEQNNQFKKSVFHPTQKPVALLEYLIKTYTNEGDIVLDNTMGSGSTGVAAQNLKRSFIGIEKDPIYFGIAQNRILNRSDKTESQTQLEIDEEVS